ncbi:peptidylprolyl isomerase [Bacteroides sp. 519]|uniref:peptidylprolyl isomerase n=1 Tax=Bacteroides sp. 519 TaxID=2302937 RepID=UPI0013D7C075|nr:peptidylprolyl isomerase [Bacteroides sp. 519]NDV58666.1 peptidylprolyl isomerase [Bacteroides sp. 519]
MATLQKIRSKGPLLIIVVGLALFAFIAGDAWKVLQPHQSNDVGEVNGESISAQEYQTLFEEYTEAIKFSNGLSSLTEEQSNQIKDEVWTAFINNKLIENEAAKIGLTVPASEIQAIIDAGVHPMLRNTPFYNQQTGMFDKDMLKKFLVDYSKLDRNTVDSRTYEYYHSMYMYWSFVERMLAQNRLAEKYQALVLKSITTNTVEAQTIFDDRVKQSDMLLAAIPYSSIPDSAITVKVSEVKELYNKRKEEFKQTAETRNIRYIDVQVVPSQADGAALQNEMLEYTTQLEEMTSDFTSFVRSTGSEVSYLDLFVTKDVYPADIVARLDSAAVGETYGPYFNSGDNTFNTFKKIAKVSAPDSIEFRQIQVYTEDVAKNRVQADSIYNAIKGGAKFEDIAAKYNQPGTTTWITSANIQANPQLDNDNLKYLSTIMDLGVNQLANVEIRDANVILQVTNRKKMVDKYKVAVVKRPNDFSNETYNKTYNDFSQFIAANNTLDKLIENAEEAGYRVTPRADVQTYEHGIAGIKNTKDALRWTFNAKQGEVSGLYEAGDNDRLLVVALEAINKEGYRSLDDVKQQLRVDVVKDKKAAQIIANMKAANATSIAQYQSMTDAISDSLVHVSFSAPAYVSALRSSESLVGAYASVAPVNQLSQPIKGNSGVFVLQPYAKDQLEESFDAEKEKTTLESTHQRIASRFISDLYQKAKVKDNRYLFF